MIVQSIRQCIKTRPLVARAEVLRSKAESRENKSSDLPAYHASSPGSLMLMGEHAVLHDHPAIVAAINQRLHIELHPLIDNTVAIQSDRFENYQTDLQTIAQAQHKDYAFILSAINVLRHALPSGFALTITSELNHQTGLGSSAAVTVATLAVLQHWIQQQAATPDLLLQQAQAVIRAVQGRGSGADCAASIYGGMVSFTQDLCVAPLQPEALPPISLVYSGSKTPTADVIQQVHQDFLGREDQLGTIFSQMGEDTSQAIDAINHSDWSRVGELFNSHQRLQAELGVNTPRLQALIDRLLAMPGMYGAKISGAGLGDCVLGLGRALVSDSLTPLSVQLSTQGTTSYIRHPSPGMMQG